MYEATFVRTEATLSPSDCQTRAPYFGGSYPVPLVQHDVAHCDDPWDVWSDYVNPLNADPVLERRFLPAVFNSEV